MTVTPSPQSVGPSGPKRVLVLKSAVERLILAADMYGVAHLDSDDMDDDAVELQDATEGMKDAIAAAPAPSSLAGGEVNPLVKRLAYGYAIMHTTICHMAGTSGASGRWYYDKANEAFGRVSPIHSITEESNPPVNGDYFSGLSNFLAALSPEAPAREGEWAYHERAIAEQIDDEESGFWRPCSGCQEGVDGYVSEKDYPYSKTFRCQPGAGCSECGGLGVLWDNIDYDQMAREMIAEEALTPRHEAPAEGAGEEIIDGIEDVITQFVKANPGSEPDVYGEEAAAEMIFEKFVRPLLRARSSAPEAREGEPVGVVYSLKGDLNTAELPDGTLLYTHPAHPSADHAELTRLAEAAGEEALGNLLAVIHGDGGHRALEVGTKQAALEAEKIVAGLFAAPSADKLRGLVGASEDILSALSALSVAGKPIASLDTKLRDAINTLVPALATLQAEQGAK